MSLGCRLSVAMSLAMRVTQTSFGGYIHKYKNSNRRQRKVMVFVYMYICIVYVSCSLFPCLFSTFDDYIYYTIINCTGQNTNKIRPNTHKRTIEDRDWNGERERKNEKANDLRQGEGAREYTFPSISINDTEKWMKIRRVNGKLAKIHEPSLTYNKLHFHGWHCGCGFYFNYRLPPLLSVSMPSVQWPNAIRKPTLLRLHVLQNKRKYNYKTFFHSLSVPLRTWCAKWVSEVVTVVRLLLLLLSFFIICSHFL